MSIKIGIIGGIGSGKSMVSQLLELMGVPVYVSDNESKRLVQTDAEIHKELVALLGEDVYRGGMLNKSLLATYLFGNAEHARLVNGIIHPRVKIDFRRWVSGYAAKPVVGIESAILLEAGFRSEVDMVVMVYAPKEVRMVRAIKRDASSREMLEKRMNSQMDDEKKRQQADWVIVNDGTVPIIPQVADLLAKLRQF